MDALKTLVTNRRGWVALVPVIVAVSALLGIEIPEDQLLGFGDQVDKLVMSALALWSLYLPKASS